MRINALGRETTKRQTFKMNMEQSVALSEAVFQTYLKHGVQGYNGVMGQLWKQKPGAVLRVEKSDTPGFLKGIVHFAGEVFNFEAPNAELLGEVASGLQKIA